MDVKSRLAELEIALPPAPQPVGAYVPAVRSGKLVMTSGQLPTSDGKLAATGKVPTDVSAADAAGAARQAALNALAALAAESGGVERIARILRVNVYVACAPQFTDQATVANGASELLVELFGEAGRHTRCAIGVAALPLNAPVELDIVAELK